MTDSTFPETDLIPSRIPSFNICCIDYRYDALTTQYFNYNGQQFNYFLGTTAGASLPLGYKEFCLKNCIGNCCNKSCEFDILKNTKIEHKTSNLILPCNPDNEEMEILKISLDTNITISRTLQNISEIYLMNHQDCGAIKAFLSCSGYPTNLGDDNAKEIEINTFLLNYSADYVYKTFPFIKTVRLGLIDINGSVADYINDKWVVVFKGVGINPKGLWYSYNI